MVFNNFLKMGEMIALMGITSTMIPSVANLAFISVSFNEAKVAFDRMFEFVNTKSEQELSGNVNEDNFESVHVENIAFRFPGRSQLLENISFKVIKGEIIALLGESGCGKSTISQILQKHYIEECGQIRINDKVSLKVISINSWRRIVGVVPQNPNIFNGSVLENIGFEDAHLNPEKVLLFLRTYGFMYFIELLPQSFRTLVGEEGINLSGGQKSMISIARALYHNPQLLILDECTAAMDRDSERFILNLLSRFKHQMGIIFITHRLHILKTFCDNIYVIENGRISANGNHDRLLDSNNLYSRYWNDLLNDRNNILKANFLR